MKLLKYLLFLFPALALGQSLSTPVDSIFAPFSMNVKMTAMVQALRLDATTGKLVAISGQTQGVAISLPDLTSTVPNAPLVAVFPGQKLSSMTVSGLRFTVVAAGLGWTGTSVVEVPVAPIIVPAGKGLAVRYDVPLIGTGTLQLAVGVVSIPPPTGPGPVVSGTITPALVTPDGTMLPPATQLIDASGAVWTILPVQGTDAAPGQVGLGRNGVRMFGSIDFATIKAGSVYVSDFGSGPGWQQWNGAAFVPSSGP